MSTPSLKGKTKGECSSCIGQLIKNHMIYRGMTTSADLLEDLMDVTSSLKQISNDYETLFKEKTLEYLRDLEDELAAYKRAEYDARHGIIVERPGESVFDERSTGDESNDVPCFEAFWQAYNKFTKRLEAEIEWGRLNTEEQVAAVNGIESFKAFCHKNGFQLCGAHCYLSRHLWFEPNHNDILRDKRFKRIDDSEKDINNN